MAADEIDRETMMRRLRRSKLLADSSLQRAYELAGSAPNGQELAKLLVKNRLLTSFQARMLLAGRTQGFFLGQYRILEPVGQGAMGRVFKAEHLGMDRVVALKVLSSQLVKTERARELFQREVKFAAKLSHPNIVTAFDANHVEDKYFLVMEYVDGPNLQELVEEDGPLHIGTACDFIRQAALGLQYAQERGLVHCDIKPSNLLVQPQNPLGPGCLVKILDFGLARLPYVESAEASTAQSKPENRTVMGTPDYLSPEQGRSLGAVDVRSDIYSLGCTFYFLLTGQPPFPGGTALEKLVRHFSEEPTPVRELRPEAPGELTAILADMMAKNPLERYQSPLDVALALVPHSFQLPGFLAAKSEAGARDSSESINLGAWPGHETALSMAGSSFLIRQPAPPPPRRWDWIQLIMLGAALGLGFVMGAAALALFLLLRSRSG